MKKAFVWAALALVAAGPLHALAPITELVDTPTAEVLDHYGYSASFRFYKDGGMLTKASFGVINRLNVGFGLDAEGFIGSQAVDLNKPTLNVKLRLYDGQKNLPALALGYDGQGLFFNEDTDKYNQREKGLYLVGSGEIITPGLSLHGGANIYDFKDDYVYGFLGTQYLIQEKFGLMVEWDNIRTGPESRLSAGGRLFITPSFSVEFVGRDLAASDRRAERIGRLTYSGGF